LIRNAAWLGRRVRGQPRIYHLMPWCAGYRHPPRETTQAAARKIARPCRKCANARLPAGKPLVISLCDHLNTGVCSMYG